MMLKQKSSPWARLKYLYVLPLTAVAVVAFARPEISLELETISSEPRPLVIIDRIEQTDQEGLSKLDPQTIESISVLKDSVSIKQYGEKGRDGVIIVVTKNATKELK